MESGREDGADRADVHPFVGSRVTHRCRVFEPSRPAAFRLMRLAMDACLIALIKIHVARRDIADDGRRRVRARARARVSLLAGRWCSTG